MFIYVHSAGRADLPLPTLDALRDTPMRSKVRLVVQAKEAKAYAGRVTAKQLIVLPKYITTLSPTRQWILQHAESNAFLLMDDDLTFSARRSDDPEKFRPASPDDFHGALVQLKLALIRYAHVGMCAREGGNRQLEPFAYATRAMRVLGYNRKLVLPTGARFDRLATKQDFDMTLQLLRAGLPNAVLGTVVHNQYGSNTAGGCSAYRTPQLMDECAHALAALHPGFVTVVQKETKTAWGGGVRTDVRIAWKKALEEGLRRGVARL